MSEEEHRKLISEVEGLNDSCSVVAMTVNALVEVLHVHSPSASQMCATCDDFYPCLTVTLIRRELELDNSSRS